MKQNFKVSLKYVLESEGGYVNHPSDPGGATNKGITWRTYNVYRLNKGLPPRDVRNITDEEVSEIYREGYWDAVRADELPSGVDYAVFDFAVNSGPRRAIKALQGVVGVAQDGIIGPRTLKATRNKDPSFIVDSLCDKRLSWLKTLRTWKIFGKGWSNRIEKVRKRAKEMICGKI